MAITKVKAAIKKAQDAHKKTHQAIIDSKKKAKTKPTPQNQQGISKFEKMLSLERFNDNISKGFITLIKNSTNEYNI